MTASPAAGNPQLDALEAALAAEREALLGHDVEALMAATQAKLDCLRALESAPPSPAERERLEALYERNTANGALLARRRREVSWALRALGRSESAPGYDTLGRMQSSMQNRSLGAA